MREQATIEAGQQAWRRLKRSRSFEDWIACGRALLVGRSFAMAKAGTAEPKGGKYSKYFAIWLQQNGFCDMPHAARHCALQIAENEKGVVRWLETLPPAKRPPIYPGVVWSAFRASVLKRSSRARWRSRLRLDEATALQVKHDVRLALRDVARHKRYEMSDNMFWRSPR